MNQTNAKHTKQNLVFFLSTKKKQYDKLRLYGNLRGKEPKINRYLINQREIRLSKNNRISNMFILLIKNL